MPDEKSNERMQNYVLTTKDFKARIRTPKMNEDLEGSVGPIK